MDAGKAERLVSEAVTDGYKTIFTVVGVVLGLVAFVFNTVAFVVGLPSLFFKVFRRG